MKILESKEYCSICKKQLKLGNIGAVILEYTAQNVCQDPCAIEYHQRLALTPITKVVETNSNNFVNRIEELQRRVRQETEGLEPALERAEFGRAEVQQPFQDQELPEHPTGFTITEEGNTLTIKNCTVGTRLPAELFYETMLTNWNITKFAILKIEVQNISDIPIYIKMKQDNTNNRLLVQFLCDSYSVLGHKFGLPFLIDNNDLIITFDYSTNPAYVDRQFEIKSILTIEIIERGG